MSKTSLKKAEDFLKYEKEFHLGVLPTEQAHPKTRNLSQIIQKKTSEGVRCLQLVDRDIPPMLERVFESEVFGQFVETIEKTLEKGGRIYFTGCGATGRLAILLEALWRGFWQELKRCRPELAGTLPAWEDRVFSVMTGGDRALIRSVEGYEDYASFGSYQMEEGGVREGDLVVAVTEGGETSSVIGTAWKGLEAGAKVFFVCNNPLDILAKHVKRSREIVEEAEIWKLDLSTGPMAVAGSTRMQAATAELVVIGTGLEMGLRKGLSRYLEASRLEELGFPSLDARIYKERFCRLLDDLESEQAVSSISRVIEYEEMLYRQNGLMTYLADEYLLDILTDTTERTPTFRLPPFRKRDDNVSARSWAFIKSPVMTTEQTWRRVMRRPLRGLDWDESIYRRLGASEEIIRNHPALNNAEILKYQIGYEDDCSRYEASDSAAMMVLAGEENCHLQKGDEFYEAFMKCAGKFKRKAALYIGNGRIEMDNGRTNLDLDELFHVPCSITQSPIDLWGRLAVKLVLNTVSTGTMARMGRLIGNLMVYVETSNKKLIDRATRLIADLAGVSYEEACFALFDTYENLERYKERNDGLPGVVPITVERIKTGDISR
jgi:N-acetylmuramic acid 6-phosphate etherase